MFNSYVSLPEVYPIRHRILKIRGRLNPCCGAKRQSAEKALTQSSHGRVWWSHSSSEKSAHWKSQKSHWAGVQTLVLRQNQGTWECISHEKILQKDSRRECHVIVKNNYSPNGLSSWIDPILHRGFKAGVSEMVYQCLSYPHDLLMIFPLYWQVGKGYSTPIKAMQLFRHLLKEFGSFLCGIGESAASNVTLQPGFNWG